LLLIDELELVDVAVAALRECDVLVDFLGYALFVLEVSS
jgi:hypothetical protein